MIEYTINGKCTLRAPENFQVMQEKEFEELFGDGDPCRWGLWDRENHVMLLAEWKKYNPLMIALADIKAVAKRNEALMSKGYVNNGYRNEGQIARKVGGLAAAGYRFSFQVGDAEQSADVLLVKHGNFVYRFTVNGRKENRDADRQLFESVMDTVTFA